MGQNCIQFFPIHPCLPRKFKLFCLYIFIILLSKGFTFLSALTILVTNLLVFRYLGSWFFFSIQREMLCWYQVCVKHKTCGTYFKCNDVNSSRNITKLVELCPMNPPNSTVYDFGIFVNPLGTSSRTPINFSTKFSYSFWWGVRNLRFAYTHTHI